MSCTASILLTPLLSTVVASLLYAVCLYRAYGALDTLSPYIYYELLIICKTDIFVFVKSKPQKFPYIVICDKSNKLQNFFSCTVYTHTVITRILCALLYNIICTAIFEGLVFYTCQLGYDFMIVIGSLVYLPYYNVL